MKNFISEGDFVDVYFEQVQAELNVEVLYTPVATGDSFKLRRSDGTIVYVCLFSKMVKVEK